ncbi:MAG TPA: glycosyltransferase family 4 protein [Flavitalea sp.]|nr:glycosyltransferase family 4 protein [Flavitalea sp.]
MNRSRKLIFAVTNDLTYDQRMIRICTTLSCAGYTVTLFGRQLSSSIPLFVMPYHQFRTRCFFNKGFLFYAEFNVRLFCYLVRNNADLICAIDLDTILPCYLASKIKKIPRVYDAHELFCEMKEVITRPHIYRFWKRIERFLVPHFRKGYSVNRFIVDEFNREYGVSYEIIKNVPYKIDTSLQIINKQKDPKLIIYQGAVNEGRSFETLIPAFKSIDAHLIVCGDGNFMKQARHIVKENDLENKIQFTGWLPPGTLRTYTRHAYIGVNIIENSGLNNQLSLSNRFFDYIQAGLPQICIDYPAYRDVNDKYNCAYLIQNTCTITIAQALNRLLNDQELYNILHENCIKAAGVYNWNKEQEKLLSFYQSIFNRV